MEIEEQPISSQQSQLQFDPIFNFAVERGGRSPEPEKEEELSFNLAAILSRRNLSFDKLHQYIKHFLPTRQYSRDASEYLPTLHSRAFGTRPFRNPAVTN